MEINLDYLRSLRFKGFAVFDLIITFLGMIFMAPFVGLTKLQALLLALPVSSVIQQTMGFDTALTRNVFNHAIGYALMIGLIVLAWAA